MRIIPIFIFFLFSCSEESSKKEPLLCTLPPAAYNPWLYTAHQTYQDPVIDGNPLEKTWQIVRWNKHYSDSNFQYKILWSENSIFILARIPLTEVRKGKWESVDVSIFNSDTLRYCRQNPLLGAGEGYDYRTKEERSFFYTELRLGNIIHQDSSLLDKKNISLSYSCQKEQKEKITLRFVR